MNKACFKCGQDKNLMDFYKNPRMADGHLNKCKVCAKTDVSENYGRRADHYIEYEKARGQSLHRKIASYGYTKNSREKFPDKHRAWRLVELALLSGKLVKEPCSICGAKAHAHHEDYSKPLDVIWLCARHHKARHLEMVPF